MSTTLIHPTSMCHLHLRRCAHTGYLQHTLRGHSGEITEMLISPCNRWLVSASIDGTIRVWRTSDGAPEVGRATHALLALID